MSAFNLNKDKNRGLMSSIISTLYHIGLQNTNTHVFMYTDHYELSFGTKFVSYIWLLFLVLYFYSDHKKKLMLYYIFRQNIYCPEICLRKINSQTGTTRKVDQLINCAPAVKLALRVLQMQNLNTKLFC